MKRQSPTRALLALFLLFGLQPACGGKGGSNAEHDLAGLVDGGTTSGDGGTPNDASPDTDGSIPGTSFSGPGPAPVDGGIINPFYEVPSWRLWALDPSPVHYAGYNGGDPTLYEADFQPTESASRQYPDLTVNTFPAPFLSLTDAFLGTAGSWDDAYATRDGSHSGLPTYWVNYYGNVMHLAGQYIRIGFGTAQPSDILRLGIDFTSESYSYSGHQLVSASYAIDDTERNFTFVNTTRASPAYLSYTEMIADRVVDSYDGLYAHALNSVGRSSSEVGGLFKMMLAGAYMPRTTKDLLKRNGAYATAMLSIFRQTLPYAEADGSPVGAASEMLQRPAYLTTGNGPDVEFIPRNQTYHQYDEGLHLYRMIQAARAMTVAPPVAIIKILGITVEKAGSTLVDNAQTDLRIHSANKTMARIWGNDGETITLRIDVGGSYDLQGLVMTPRWQAVYPEQKNVTITHEAGTIWRVSAKHDATLPKGRIPVALFVDNGQLQSGPAFVNFYWAEPGQYDSPAYVSPGNPISTDEVTKNLRPIFTTSLPTDYLNVTPGSTAEFDLNCADPEGRPTRFYRWLGEAGTLSGTHFSLPVAASDVGRVYPIHLVCSDGTGGYDSLLVRVTVTPNDGVLPAPWQTNVYGFPEAAGSAQYNAGAFEIVGNGVDMNETDNGRIVFHQYTGDAELSAQVMGLSVDGSTASSTARVGVMLREHLGPGAKNVFAYAQGNDLSAVPLALGGRMRAAYEYWYPNTRNASLGTQPSYVKAVRRGTTLAGLGSSDGSTWEQLWSAEIAGPSTQIYAGLVIGNSDNKLGDALTYARGKLKVLATPAVSVPVASMAGRPYTFDTLEYKTKATVTLIAGSPQDIIRYTTDGSDPTPSSTVYTAPFDVTSIGTVPVKARSFSVSGTSGITVVPLTILP